MEATDIVLPPTHRAPIVGGTLEAVGVARLGKGTFLFRRIRCTGTAT